MPYDLAVPVLTYYDLPYTDELFNVPPESKTTVAIRQVSQAGDKQRSAMFALVTRVLKDEDQDIRIEQSTNPGELVELEAYLTLADCNITYKSKPLFTFRADEDGLLMLDMTREQFAKAWGKLDPHTAREIHAKVLEKNLIWSGQGK